jgi:dihydrolipoamide dehydrogenase
MKTDLIIIGSGPGGYKAAPYAAKHGLKVVLVERGPLGGTCLNCGCIPTKSLVHDAASVDASGDLSGQFAASVARKDEVVGTLRNGVETQMQQSGVTVVKGEASFVDSTHVKVGDETIEANDIIIATGSKSKMLRIPGADSDKVMTSEQLLSCSTLPHKLCIIGAGVIGMEMASVFASYGCEVTVVEFLKECLPPIDQDIAKRLRKLLEKRGIDIRLNCGVTRIEGNTVVYNNLKKQREEQVEADAILMSVGRVPNTDGLNLEAIGVNYTPKGIVVDDNMQTNVPHVYAIGDVNGRMMLAHAATFQGYRAINHIVGQKDDIRLDIIPSAVFTAPEAAAVGLTEDACKEQGLDYTVHKAFWRANGRALAMKATDGMLKLICNQNDVIIGCHAYGADSAALIQEVAALMNLNATRHQLSQIVHIHPTISEILLDAAEN